MIQQIVPVIQQVSKVYEYEKEPKIIIPPPTIEIIERITPKLINVNRYVERLVDKIVKVPHLLRQTQIQQVKLEQQVAGLNSHTREEIPVEMKVQKELIREVEKEITNTVNRVEQVLEVVTSII